MRGAWKDYLLGVVVLAVIIVAALWAGSFFKEEHRCHSLTQDSPIYDCNYQDGEWQPK